MADRVLMFIIISTIRSLVIYLKHFIKGEVLFIYLFVCLFVYLFVCKCWVYIFYDNGLGCPACMKGTSYF